MFIWGGDAEEGAGLLEAYTLLHGALAGAFPPGRRKYRRRLALVSGAVERAQMDLEGMRAEAGAYYSAQAAAWQEGPDGMRYLAALRQIDALAEALGRLPAVDAGVLR